MTSGDAASISPAHSLVVRLKRLWWLKAAGTFAFMWTFFHLYFQIQESPRFPVTQIPLTWLDRAIPLQSWGWIPYLSLWLYTSLPPALQPDFWSLVYYGVCIGVVCGAGLLFFYFWPTAIPEAINPPQATFAWLHGIDLARNACPSLHVATAVFSSLWLHRHLRLVGAGQPWRSLNFLWGVTIVYSTLVTKQHVVWDVVAGIALGGCGALASMYTARYRTRIFRGICDELQRF